MNEIACECGAGFDSSHVQEHMISKEHQKYAKLKKAYMQAISRKVKIRVAS